jgi:hypothetical protein
LRINYLTPEAMWTRKMSIGRRLYVEHVARVENVGVFHEPDFDADVLWCYKTEGFGVDEFDGPKVIVFNEANDPAKTLSDIAGADATHVIFHHPSDYWEWQADLSQMGITSSTQPHAGFIGCSPDKWNSRDIKCLMTGVSSAEVYPLRYRYETALRHGLNGMRLPHPGYRLSDERQLKSQYAHYVSMLRRSKISLCCTSIFNYPLAKLYESAAAGCVIATDKPDCPEFCRKLWPYCIQLRSDMQCDEIVEVVNSYSDDGLRFMAEETFKAWKENFTPSHWVKSFLEQVRERVTK